MRLPFEAQTREAFNSLAAIGIGLIEAFLVIVAARLLLRFVRDRVLRRLDNPNLSEEGRATIDVFLNVVIGIGAITFLLAIWGITWSGIITAISLGTVGILLGIQDVLKSLIGGIFLVMEQPYTIGDRIKVRDITGRVIGIELRTTILRSDDGHRIVAPNSIVFTDTMTNFSLRRNMRTYVIASGVHGERADIVATIETVIHDVEEITDTADIRVLENRTKVVTPIRDRIGKNARGGRAITRAHEVRVSWLGSGDPEIQAAVVARLRALYPKAKLRVRKRGGLS